MHLYYISLQNRSFIFFFKKVMILFKIAKSGNSGKKIFYEIVQFESEVFFK